MVSLFTKKIGILGTRKCNRSDHAIHIPNGSFLGLETLGARDLVEHGDGGVDRAEDRGVVDLSGTYCAR